MKVLVDADKIKKTLIELLIKLGIERIDAEIIIDCYIEADLCGVSTHGLSILPAHIDKIIKKIYNINPNIHIEKSGISFTIMDGDNAIGPVSAYKSMQLAVDKAKKTGIYFVFSKNNNTLGPAFYYNNIAIKENMIGITITNSPAAMAPINGKTKLFGTNPIAISIPSKNENPIILDMATSSVAKSKIKQALLENKKIPLDWATDQNGNLTDDPKEAINGLILPMAGYKGYGLAMMIDIISGVLSGAQFLNGVGKFYGTDSCMNVGYTFVAIDPKQICDFDFLEKMDDYIKTIKKSENVAGKEIMLPGENRIENRKNSIKYGISLEEKVVEELEEILEKFNVDKKLR